MKRNKKAAIELSMTTIVVVVLSLTLLIMGFILVRSIMCGVINLTNDIGDKAKSQIDELFGSTGGEIQCIGESGSPVAMFPDETNIVWCGVRAPEKSEYKFNVKPKYDVKNSIPETQLKNWFESMNFKRDISPGDEAVKQIARLIIPENAPSGDIVLDIDIYKDNELISTKTVNYKVSRKGFIQSAIC